MFNKTLICSAIGLSLLAGTAMASPDEYEREEYYERRGPMPFEVLDLNGDGVVTAEEHARVRSERQAFRSAQGYPMRNASSAPRFEKIDTDANGSISRDELSAWQLQCQSGKGRSARWDD